MKISIFAFLALCAAVAAVTKQAKEVKDDPRTWSPETRARMKVYEKVDHLVSAIEVFKDGTVPASMDQVEKFRGAIDNVSRFLNHEDLGLRVTTKEIMERNRTKEWFVRLLRGQKVDWLTMFRMVGDTLEAKFRWKMAITQDKEALEKCSERELEAILKDLDNMQELRGLYMEKDRSPGTLGWVDDLISKNKGDLMLNFPSYLEIDNQYSMVLEVLKKKKAIEPTPPKSKEKEKGTPAPQKPSTPIGPEDTKNLALIFLRVSF